MRTAVTVDRPHALRRENFTFSACDQRCCSSSSFSVLAENLIIYRLLRQDVIWQLLLLPDLFFFSVCFSQDRCRGVYRNAGSCCWIDAEASVRRIPLLSFPCALYRQGCRQTSACLLRNLHLQRFDLPLLLPQTRIAIRLQRTKISLHIKYYSFSLTFWRRNYFFLILAHPVYNVNNTGTKYVRIMKQTAF